MSKENVETVPDERLEQFKEAFRAFSAGDFDAVAPLIDPTLEIHDRILPEGSPRGRGIDALVANAARVREVFGDATWEPVQIVELGGRVAIRVRVTGKGQHTALPIDEDIGHVYAFREGKLTRIDIFRTWNEALEAAEGAG
jgi:ketosteroid isomerase-like protein